MRMAGEVQGSQDRGILEVLNVELKTYEMELPRLLGRCAGMVGPHPQYVVIKVDRAIGPIDTENDAIHIGYDNFGHVPMLVKPILQQVRPVTFTRDLF